MIELEIQQPKGRVIIINDVKLKALLNLQTIQHHTIINNQLNYHLDGHLSLQLLCQQRYIKYFSFGQLILIIQSVQNHLIKVYQEMNITQLLLENIYFNNKLKVKFINLHEIEGELSYEQNHQRFIKQVEQIFFAYKKYYSTFLACTNFQQQIKIVEKLTIISNKVLGILESKKHYKKLQIFIKENLTNQQFNDQLINIQIIDPLEFSQLFEIHQLKDQNPNDIEEYKSDMNFSNVGSSHNSRSLSNSEVQKQLQFQQNLCQGRIPRQNVEQLCFENEILNLDNQRFQQIKLNNQNVEVEIQND